MSPWPAPTEDGALCCICLEWTPIEKLNIDPVDGRREDVCYECRDK